MWDRYKKLDEEGRKDFINDMLAKPVLFINKSKSYMGVLRLMYDAPDVISFSITKDSANEIIKDFKVDLKCGLGDMIDEVSGFFEFRGEVMKLKRDWKNCWSVHNGEWESDPRRTGD